jgi:uncharacterized protein YndB with AHSA1/START domain
MASGPAGREATETVHIAAAPERVWAVVANVRGHAALAGSGEVLAIRMDGPVVAGATFEGDIRVGEVGSFVSRNVVEEVSEPHRLAWVSYPPLDEDETEDHQIEVHWSFDLVPAEGGTELRHGFRGCSVRTSSPRSSSGPTGSRRCGRACGGRSRTQRARPRRPSEAAGTGSSGSCGRSPCRPTA